MTEILDYHTGRILTPMQELYPPDDGEGGRSHFGDYNPLLRSLGEIALQVDDEDYSGDSRVLYQAGEHFGLLVFGWGSCCGCDSLLACSSYEEVEGLRDQLRREIIWHPSAGAMLAFIENRDWDLQFCGHAGETREFIAKALSFLRSLHSETGAVEASPA